MSPVTDEPNLTDWLAGRSTAQLAEVLQNRPDARWGAPLRGIDDFGARLTRPASVAEAIARLPLPGVELLHALAALGPAPTIAGAAELWTRVAEPPGRSAKLSVTRWRSWKAVRWPG